MANNAMAASSMIETLEPMNNTKGKQKVSRREYGAN